MTDEALAVQRRLVRALAEYAEAGGKVAWWAVGSERSSGDGPLVVIECANARSLSQLTRRAAPRNT